jgi:hypothetical protein
LPEELFKLHARYYHQAYFQSLPDLWVGQGFGLPVPKSWKQSPFFSITYILRKSLFGICLSDMAREKTISLEKKWAFLKMLRKIRVLSKSYPDHKFEPFYYSDIYSSSATLNHSEVLQALDELLKDLPRNASEQTSLISVELEPLPFVAKMPQGNLPDGVVKVVGGSWTKLYALEEIVLVVETNDLLFDQKIQQYRDRIAQEAASQMGLSLTVTVIPKPFFEWLRNEGDCMLKASFPDPSSAVVQVPIESYHAWLMRSLVYAMSRAGGPISNLEAYTLPLIRHHKRIGSVDLTANPEVFFNETLEACVKELASVALS